MIVCTKCGMHNADTDDFCGQCGAFLEWEGEKVQPQAAPVVETPTPVEPEVQTSGVIGRVKAAIGIEGKPEMTERVEPEVRSEPSDAAPPVVAPPAQVPPTTDPSSTATSAAPSSTPVVDSGDEPLGSPAPEPPGPLPPSPPAEGDAAVGATEDAIAAHPTAEQVASEEKARRAEALLAKPAATDTPSEVPSLGGSADTAPAPPEAMPAARQPEAVKPAVPRQHPTPRRPTARERTIRPGDLICGQCGEGNEPTRNFCRRCGTSLQEAVTVAPLPWWRRIFRRKPKGAPAAGTRPAGRRQAGAGRELPNVSELIKRLAVVAVAVLAVVAIAVPSVRRSIPRSTSAIVRTFIYHYSPIAVTRADAMGNEVAGHPAANVFQGDVNGFWAAPTPKPGTKPRIRLFFSGPHDISLIRITSGDPSNFDGSPRPSVIEYQFSDGKTHPPLQIENIQTPQKFKVSAKHATYLDIIVDDVYPVAGSTFYSAISRIEAFQKKAGK